MSTTVKWGLITGMVYVIFSLLNNMLGIQPGGANQGLSFLMSVLLMLVTFFTLFMGVKEKRDSEMGGYMTFGQGFKSGMGIALIAAVIAAVFTLVYMMFIDPDMGERMMDGIEEQWDKAGMAEDQREMARKWTSMMFNPPIMTAFMLAYVLFWGVIKSLVASAIVKREAPPVVPEV